LSDEYWSNSGVQDIDGDSNPSRQISNPLFTSFAGHHPYSKDAIDFFNRNTDYSA
jgi:hypothetical protein